MKAPNPNKIEHSGKWTFRVYDDESVPTFFFEKFLPSETNTKKARVFKTTTGRRTIWIYKTASENGPDIFIKHYSRPSVLKQFKYLLRNSRTRQEWEMGLSLKEMGFPVARPLAMAERRKHGLLQEDYLFQESLSDHENFDFWFSRNFGPQDNIDERTGSGAGGRSEERRQVINKLAELVRWMHELGVMQRDFKPDSIMVGPSGDFKLVDLERVLIKRRRRGLSLSDRLKNLAKIDQAFGHIGTTLDRLRFLCAYFRDDGLSRERLSEYAGAIARFSEIEFRKQARDRCAWVSSVNESYTNWTYRGFRVFSYRKSIRSFLRSIIDRTRDGQGFAENMDTGDPGLAHNARWCWAFTAFARSPQLRYRRIPHVVPEAALLPPGSDDWGLLVYPSARKPYLDIHDASFMQPGADKSLEFYRDLGRFLRILHRAGITWQWHPQDFLLCNHRADRLRDRFLVNRLELLVMDHTPSQAQAYHILEEITLLLGLCRENKKAVYEGYDNCMVRHFSSFVHLRLPRDYERPRL